MRYILFLTYFMLLTANTSLAAAEGKTLPLDNSNLPIEITADKLIIQQKKTQAVFSGHVEAKQGTVNMRSNKMTVHYREQEEKSDKSAIQRVDVEGNVFLSTEKETASGRKGVYNVDESTVTLEGDVILTQGENIIKGGKMVHNTKTGVSEMIRGKSNDTDGRVYMYAVPKSQPKKEKKENE